MRKRFSLNSRRGIAMLLVMIALCVGTLMTAGFLLTQSTSVGIARNQRDGEKARYVAESGVDMCLWLIKNNTNWRTAMSPGNWLNNYSLAGGTVTVTAADSTGATNFTTNYTDGVTLTGVGTVNGRTYTVTAIAKPTGGGTPFSSGIFSNQGVTLASSSVIDSFNSALGIYIPGSNAVLATNASSNNALTIDSSSSFKGSFLGGILGLVSSILNLATGAVGPTATAIESTPRTVGSIIFPNTTSLPTPSTAWSQTRAGGSTMPATSASYTSFTCSAGKTTVTAPGTYYITGNMNVTNSGSLSITGTGQVTFIVLGNLTLQNSVQLSSANANVSIYVGGNATINTSITYGLLSPVTSLFALFLGPNGGNVTIDGQGSNISVAGTIIAPQSAITIKGNAQVYGNALGASLNLSNGQLHMDTATLTNTVHNLTGGSFMGDYSISWQQ